jgi:DNA mismatch repair protein MutS
MSMAIQEYNGRLSFTYKYTQGPADKSYGIHVAEMAGLPAKVLEEASALLKDYENQATQDYNHRQLSLFS